MERVPVKNSDIVWRNVGGETVLLDPQSGRYFGLNAVGCAFWEKIDGRISLADVVDLLLLEYEVERSVLEADIGELADALAANGLLTMK
jgi:hypothetical protein